MKDKKDSSSKKGSYSATKDEPEVRKDRFKNRAPQEKVPFWKKILAIVLTLVLIFVFFLIIVLTSPFLDF